MFGDSRVDVVEIFGGAAEISLQFARRGWHVVQPIDLEYGHDLRDSAVRQQVIDLVNETKPRLVIVSWPCRFWGKLVDVNFSTPQRKRRLHQLRKEERPFLELTETLFDIQIKNNADALGKNPLASHAFKEPPIKRLLNRPEISVGVSHGCRFNMRHPQNGMLLKKPTLWISTSVEIADAVSLRCENRTGKCEGKQGRKTNFERFMLLRTKFLLETIPVGNRLWKVMRHISQKILLNSV